MKKILIGGSPCTHWSIAQKNNREVTAEGIGWELFKNYLIAKEKFQPDFFLYENNKSAAQPIKDQISIELGVPLQYINSALVSAQNRQRFYAHNMPDVPQPEDRGILLRDILESGESVREKAYTLDANYSKAAHTDMFCRAMKRTTVFENVKYLSEKEMEYMVRQTKDGRNHFDFGHYSNSIEDKSHAVTANMSKGVPYNVLTEPVRIGSIGSNSQAHRVYVCDGKSVNLVANGGGQGAKTGLYDCPVEKNGKQHPVYKVKNGLITIKDKQYPIKLADGYYIIRKLTVTECCRLQTMPDDYCRAVSASQAYKGLGNGWTAEVIIHILKHMNIPLDEEIVVLSMYDGIGTGRYCFDRLGYKNVQYYAYEIDKYAKQVAMSNYPDIIQCGDAFQVRDDGWGIRRR